MEAAPISEAFQLICELAHKRGARSIKDEPGLHVVKIDDHWTAKVNPHGDTVDHVLPYHIWLEWNGWPAGMIHATSGGLVAAGSLANEGTLIEAVKAAIEREDIHE